MPTQNLADCAKILKLPYKGENAFFSSISIDTRTLKEGELFIAIKGEKWNGHEFIEIAHHKKAAAVISELPIDIDIPHLQVPNTRIALGLLAQHHRQQLSLPIVALTGSCGKTTTKEYLRSIFTQLGATLAPVKSFNNDIGVPLTLLQLTKKHQFAVLEMGASAPFEIQWLTQLAKPHIAIILNIAPAHLKGFGSIKEIAKAKSEIFEGLPQNGIAILPITFKKSWPYHLPAQQKIYFGHTPEADVYAKNVRLEKNKKATFELVSKKEEVTITLPLQGIHQVDNALAATAAALAIGVPLFKIKNGLETTQSISHRLNTNTTPYGIIIDDVYNANPTSVYAALTLLSSYPAPRALVLGDMSELGTQSEHYHREVGEWANQFNIQMLFTYGKESKKAIQNFKGDNQHFDSQTQLIQTLKGKLQQNHTTLIKGSRCMEMEKIVSELT